MTIESIVIVEIFFEFIFLSVASMSFRSRSVCAREKYRNDISSHVFSSVSRNQVKTLSFFGNNLVKNSSFFPKNKMKKRNRFTIDKTLNRLQLKRRKWTKEEKQERNRLHYESSAIFRIHWKDSNA